MNAPMPPKVDTAAIEPAETAVLNSNHLVSKNVTVSGHRTSVRLEPDMWEALKEICRRERATLHEVCTQIAAHRRDKASLTAAIRVFIMAYFRAAATDDGHHRAGHGNGTPKEIMATMVGPASDMQHGYRNGKAGSW